MFCLIHLGRPAYSTNANISPAPPASLRGVENPGIFLYVCMCAHAECFTVCDPFMWMAA